MSEQLGEELLKQDIEDLQEFQEQREPLAEEPMKAGHSRNSLRVDS